MAIEAVTAYLRGFGAEDRIRRFPVSSATVELAAQALGVEGARIAKTLAFLMGEGAALVVAAGDKKVDNRKFKAFFGTKAKMVPPERLGELVGHEMGGVCPFAVKPGCGVYLDVSLKRFEMVHSAAGDDYTTFDSSPEILEKYTPCKGWVDVCKILGEE